MQDFIPPLLEAVLGDYQQSLPEVRDADVLARFSTIIQKLREIVAPRVMDVFAAVFEPTLEMITNVVFILIRCRHG